MSLLIVAMLLATPLARGTLTLQTAAVGITIGGTHPNFTGTLGNVNGLGVGTPSTGVSVITTGVPGGVLYTTPYALHVTGVGYNVYVTAYVSSNFARPTILTLYSCPINTACTTFSNFSVLSTSAAAPTTIIPSPGVGNSSTSTATLGLFVSNANGAAVTGAESATITFYLRRVSNNNLNDTVYLALNNETVQTAVQLLMAAAGGLPITAGSGTDYAMDFGNVNGLGIAPPTGLTVTSVSGGVVYATPYLLQPTFSSFTSTTGTLKTYVSTDFAHNSVLQLDAATAIGGPFTAISKSSATQTVLTSSATSGTNFTSYLGLFVSNVNGAGAFTGADNATLTYTLTVP
ncbi:MAG: hypothetical protein ABSF14_12135 [Terriglobia bacterium]